MSRDKFKKVYLKENPPSDPVIPGPGTYQPQNGAFNKTQSGFTLKSRNAVSSAFYVTNRYIPGPGTYNETRATDNNLGYYMSSRFKSPGGAVIPRNGAKRFDNPQLRKSAELPGPGRYSDKSWLMTRKTVSGLGIINKSTRKS